MNAICAQVLDLADRQIGYKETGDNVTKYARFFDVEAWQWFNTKKNGVKGEAGGWCAIFICWLFAQDETLGQKQALSFLGCPAPKNNCAAGCGYLYDYMKAKGYKSDIDHVQPGDIVFFKSGKKCAHVGICLDVDGNNIHTIEGNKGDQVKKCHHYRNSDIYFGVMSPDWSKAHFYKQPEAATPAPAPIPEAPKPEKPSNVLKAGDLMTVTTKFTELMLRAYASTSAPTIQRMKKGWKVTYLGEESRNSTGLWYKVRCNTVIGWACAKENGVSYSYLTKA